MTPNEINAEQIGRRAGQAVTLNNVAVNRNQYHYHPYTDLPKPPAAINEAKLWEHCPETRNMAPTIARIVTEEYARVVRARWAKEMER